MPALCRHGDRAADYGTERGAMKESQNWYVRRGKEIKGPFPAGLVSRYLLLGRVRENDEVSRDRQEWFQAGRVAELIPEAMRLARANPDDEEAQERLAAARRWADERRDVRGTPPESGDDRRKEEQSAEEIALRSAHLAREDEFSAVPLVTRRDYLIIAVLVALLAALPFVLPSRHQVDKPQCAAPPAPRVNWSNCRLQGQQYPNSNLAQAHLRNADLTGALLRAANLAGADVAYADLTLAILRGANLSHADLKGASLRQADLSNADLTGADLAYADLRHAILDGATLTGAVLDNAIWVDGTVCLPGSVGTCKPGRPAS